MNIAVVKEQHPQDENVQKWINKYLDQYFYTNSSDVQDVLHYCKSGNDEQDHWKLELPRSMVKPAIKWFHLVTDHPGEKGFN